MSLSKSISHVLCEFVCFPLKFATLSHTLEVDTIYYAALCGLTLETHHDDKNSINHL
jgi:hypothetical protein